MCIAPFQGLFAEVELLRSLSHPAILHLQDVFDTDDALYIVTVGQVVHYLHIVPDIQCLLTRQLTFAAYRN